MASSTTVNANSVNTHSLKANSIISSVSSTVTATAAGVSISSADSGKVIPVDMSGTDMALILPYAQVGLKYTFVLTVDAGALANNSFISAGPLLVPTQHFFGTVGVQEDDTASTGGSQSVPLATTTQNHLCFATDSTLTGGQGGNHVTVECISAGSWFVTGQLTTSGTPAAVLTPMFTAAEIAA
jgi:hypothetical protein